MDANLVARFGPGGEVARPTVGALLCALAGRSRGPAAAALQRWRAQGAQVSPGAAGAARWSAHLARRYGVAPETDLPTLIFAIHTYLALVLKLFALGLVEERSAPAREGLLAACAAARNARGLGRLLARLEEGATWTRVGLPDFTREDPYGWYPAAWSSALAKPVQKLAGELQAMTFQGAFLPRGHQGSWIDPAKALYEALLPGEWRRRGGEFFTPDWLAELAADEIGYHGDPDLTVIDPACGSGTFLALAIARLRDALERETTGRLRQGRILTTIVAQIHGADLNPLAVLAARTTYLLAVVDLVGPERPVRIPVKVGDTLLGEGPARRADIILTNPPWVRWSALDEGYRRRLWPLWQASGLLAARGYQARLATAEVDLAMLFLHVDADRWLKPAGRMAAVITLELLRAKAGAQGFRRFRLETGGEWLRPLKVHDLSALGPFAAANKTGLLLLQKGELPVYPVPYVVWSVRAAPAAGRATLAQVRAAAHCRTLMARPGDPDATGPWRLAAAEDTPVLERLQRPSAYRARRGVSTDPYAVFHLELLGRPGVELAAGPGVEPAGEPLGGRSRGRLKVANLAGRGRTSVPRIEFKCETELLYPALPGREIHRWLPGPATLVLCPNRSPRQGDLLPEREFRRRYPRAFAYLSRHRNTLLARSTYWAFYGRDATLDRIPRRPGAWHYRWAERPGRAGPVVQASAAPFYAWRDVGTYSFATWKVVWGRMSAHLGAAVVGPVAIGAGPGHEDADRRRKPILPLDTTAFIACETAAEAHFLCALLNASYFERALRSLSAPGRGFAAPSAINALALERFDAGSPSHCRLAGLSRRCHAAARRGRPTELARLEVEVDRAAAGVWGLFVGAARSATL